MGYLDRLDADGPKKLLALDGGGIRGVITIEILDAIEGIVRSKLGQDAVLGDYFDYIGGTSIGAVIAAALSLGKPVSEIRTLFHEHGKHMFDHASILNRYRFKFDSAPLQGLLQKAFGEHTTLGDPKFKTLLMMVLRNATTDAPWPLSNLPTRHKDPDRTDCINFPLWQLVRASTAAPTYFPPELFRVGEQDFIFVDGAVTMFNNPAFQLFLMATLSAYGLGWPTGEDNILLVSVGTGTAPKEDDRLRPDSMNLLYNAKSVPAALMTAALNQQDVLCRVFGRCRHGPTIDRELGDLINPEPGRPESEPGHPGDRMFTYVRYNVELTTDGLAKLGLAYIRPENVHRLDSVDYVPELQTIGQKVAQRDVKTSHFDGFL
jgi:patatin-like phospholipase/acyl hydrolase